MAGKSGSHVRSLKGGEAGKAGSTVSAAGGALACDATKIAVIIPFYQRDPGFLRRAVESVFAQRLSRAVDVEVTVIDDGSPASVGDEELPEAPPGFSVRILRQANGGAGSARNAGLDVLTDDVDFVAFLDSDDVWYENHLEYAIHSMAAHAKIYFSNVIDDENVELFQYSNFMSDIIPDHDAHKKHFYFKSGREIFDQCLQDYFIHTSQVVYRFDLFPTIRFRTDLRRSGEDLLFWLDVVEKSDIVGFCIVATGERGRGISINRESFSWGHLAGIERSLNEITVRRSLKSRFLLSAAQLHQQHRQQIYIERTLLFLMARNARLRPIVVAKALFKMIRIDSAFLLRLPGLLITLPAHRTALLKRQSYWSTHVKRANQGQDV